MEGTSVVVGVAGTSVGGREAVGEVEEGGEEADLPACREWEGRSLAVGGEQTEACEAVQQREGSKYNRHIHVHVRGHPQCSSEKGFFFPCDFNRTTYIQLYMHVQLYIHIHRR